MITVTPLALQQLLLVHHHKQNQYTSERVIKNNKIKEQLTILHFSIRDSILHETVT
jgi:hypothetical protein